MPGHMRFIGATRVIHFPLCNKPHIQHEDLAPDIGQRACLGNRIRNSE